MCPACRTRLDASTMTCPQCHRDLTGEQAECARLEQPSILQRTGALVFPFESLRRFPKGERQAFMRRFYRALRSRQP